MFNTFTTLAVSLAATTFFGIGNGHLILSSPVPFGLDSLNNSPLVDAKPGSSGADYPCKLRTGVYDITAMNNMVVGQSMELSFTGSASHGGGTCQLAITTDLEPAANTTFKLIQTFEGGCPIQADGNDGTHPFTFDLPTGTPNGRLTFAWMWYNRVGNREIYMNCAPLDVTGGSDSLDYYDSLPNAYVINLPTSECSTVETSNQEIPFPGQFILKDDSVSAAAASGPSCAASAAAQTEGVSGYKSATSANGAATQAPAKNADVTGAATGAATQTAAASSSAAGGYGASSQASMTSAAAASATSSNSASSAAASTGSGSFVTISTAAATTSAEPSAYPTMTASSAAGVAAPSGYAAASGTGSSSSGSSGTTCSDDGALVCNGSSQFGLCNHGSVVWQAVAAGTTCSNGAIQKRSVIRHPHIRRHARNAGAHN
ncbi:hypothetical protein LTR36_001038 [Oleoguttula mirabilis]|uniref:Lytic polysaccharide monooxygenase n=1 Tax=Oleoguttula mirabilis TaxID=1507867 RepID=A0AAV9JP98_9PEZI|nr:hypothetical protein LTR36_001038 [Oleoguttula mirabilis]